MKPVMFVRRDLSYKMRGTRDYLSHFEKINDTGQTD